MVALFFDFSVSSLTSFAGLEQKLKHAYSQECAPDQPPKYLPALVMAAKFAAAIGCSDQEIEIAVRRADNIATELDWQAERKGADEPAEWISCMLREGRLQVLLDAPHAEHDTSAWDPQPNTFTSGITFNHAYSMIKPASDLAKERTISQVSAALDQGAHLPAAHFKRMHCHRLLLCTVGYTTSLATAR